MPANHFSSISGLKPNEYWRKQLFIQQQNSI
jgi:hypothetical protein